MNRPAGEERRTTARQYFDTPTGEVILWVSFQQWIPAQLIDTSPGGIGVLIQAGLHQFELDFQVRVEFEQAKQIAVVTSVCALDDTHVRVGLKWVDSSASLLDDPSTAIANS